MRVSGCITLLVMVGLAPSAPAQGKLTHGYADADGVKIHYATQGEGPLVVLIHGLAYLTG